MAGDDLFDGFVEEADYTFGVKDAVDEFFGGKRNHRVYMTRDAGNVNTPDVFLNWYVLKCAE